MQGLALSDAVDRMRGPPNSKITLTLHRDGVEKPIEVSMLREIIKIQVVKDRMEPDDVGYVRLTQFTEQANEGIKKAVEQLKAEAAKDPTSGGKLKALILDLRNNPGGLLDQAIAVSSDFIDEGEIVSTRARHAEDSQRWNAKGGDIIPGVPLVVLINNGSASSSRDRRGRLAGPSPRRAAGHQELRQGIGADRHPAARQRRDAADHGALLHAVRPLDPGPGDHARRDGARVARGAGAASGRSTRRT